ncbi:hypothetical protein TIFTF001_021493 [Ficus carica]|uniref:Uncharacterized protein n=1 Tax=Ficus carica TaxID=3494 RepID=A0AA88ACU7_FICCA|nr:hypothetical protein TIFTF001_021493 [Ficus carica]
MSLEPRPYPDIRIGPTRIGVSTGVSPAHGPKRWATDPVSLGHIFIITSSKRTQKLEYKRHPTFKHKTACDSLDSEIAPIASSLTSLAPDRHRRSPKPRVQYLTVDLPCRRRSRSELVALINLQADFIFKAFKKILAR